MVERGDVDVETASDPRELLFLSRQPAGGCDLVGARASAPARETLLRDIFLFLVFFYRNVRLDSKVECSGRELTCQRRVRVRVCVHGRVRERERERGRTGVYSVQRNGRKNHHPFQSPTVNRVYCYIRIYSLYAHVQICVHTIRRG